MPRDPKENAIYREGKKAGAEGNSECPYTEEKWALIWHKGWGVARAEALKQEKKP